jgi:hypothetical protein
VTAYDLAILICLRNGIPLAPGAAPNVAASWLRSQGLLDFSFKLTKKGLAACDRALAAAKDLG